MFCPKCGTQNPETGRFCRSCGTDLGNVSNALTGNLPKAQPLVDRKGKPINWERAIVKLFSGLAFIAVAIALAVTGMGRGWWFWMLIPAFMSLGAGVAQMIALKKAEKNAVHIAPAASINVIANEVNPSLPPPQTEFVSPDTSYKTGDLVPPSVTDNTTRHLEMNSEGETMTLPKQS
jgi:hypothetical protein